MNRKPTITHSDRRALFLLELVLAIALIAGCIYSWHTGGGTPKADSAQTDSTRAYYERGKTSAPNIIYAEQEEVVETFPFDPNTADSTTLLRLGLAPWQVRSIYRYRARHGRYHTAQDFARLPGMTHEMWQRLSPHIRIGKQFQLLTEMEKSPSSAPHAQQEMTHPEATKDTTHQTAKEKYTQQEKLPQGSVVDLNTADTTQLKKIPGIASYRAGKIVEYRNRLGGYLTTEQVMEACQMPDDVLEWFVIATPQIRKINLNTASVQQMMRHPYITFYKAKEIFEYRRKNGNFTSADDLLQHGLLTPEEKEKLQGYLEF